MSTDNYASTISQVEVLGFHKLEVADATYFQSVFALLRTLPVSSAIISRAILLRQQQRLTLGDALIAATALEYGLELATRNVGDFTAIAGLAVYNPFTT